MCMDASVVMVTSAGRRVLAHLTQGAARVQHAVPPATVDNMLCGGSIGMIVGWVQERTPERNAQSTRSARRATRPSPSPWLAAAGQVTGSYTDVKGLPNRVLTVIASSCWGVHPFLTMRRWMASM